VVLSRSQDQRRTLSIALQCAYSVQCVRIEYTYSSIILIKTARSNYIRQILLTKKSPNEGANN
jgi:hypothetical protein